MSNQVRGMAQANRNAQDANNLLATAESGLSDISDILSKMRELSVQASTDTLNDADRASIDLEFQSLKDELTRIANVTEYNGMNILNGTYQQGAGENTPVSLATSQNNGSYDQLQPGTNLPLLGGPSAVNQENTESDGGGGGPTFWQSFTPSQSGTLDRIDFFVGPGAIDANSNALDNLATIDIYEGEGTDGTKLSTGTLMLLSGGTTGSKWREYSLPDSIDVTAESTYTFQVSINQQGVGWTDYNFDGSDVYPRGRSQHSGGVNDHMFKAWVTPTSPAESDPHGTAGPANVNVDGPSDDIRGHWRVQIGADNDINNQHEFSITNASANGLDLENDNVLSVDNSRTAITAIDHAIDEINRERSYIGSEQNKLQFTMSNLTSQTQSIESARSSIEDVDFAAEASDLAKNQILAQSGTAMLAQASAISQNILSLIAA